MSGTFDANLIGFRLLAGDDLPLMHHWLNEGPALQWYGQTPTTLEEIATEYGTMTGGRGNVLAMIATYAGEPVGYVQRYLTHEHPDYWGDQDLPAGTAGIDLFIGERAYLHRGFGPLLIRAFLRGHVFAGQAARCIIDPDPTNAIAIRAYEKLGFRYLRTIGPPEHEDDAYLMALEAEEFLRDAG
jgi:aminoglycoside 6'-N-acetyltransferase